MAFAERPGIANAAPFLYGLLAAIPVAGNINTYYWATDVNTLYRDDGANWNVEVGGYGEYTYICVWDGANMTVRNGAGDAVYGPEADADVAVNWALTNLTAGRTEKERIVVTGNFTINDAIVLVNYTILEIIGTITMDSGPVDNIIEAVGTAPNRLTDIEVVGGHLIGNGDAYVAPVNTQCGIFFNYVNNCRIENVEVDTTPSFGLMMDEVDSAGAAVTSTLVMDVRASGSIGQGGIRITNGNRVRMDICYTYGNNTDGYYIATLRRSSISACISYHDDDDGFHIGNCRDTTFTACIGRLNTTYAFQLWGTNENTELIGCQSEVNLRHAFYITGVRYTLIGCRATNFGSQAANTWDGFHVTTDGADIEFIGCVAKETDDNTDQRNGFYIGGDNCILESCRAEGNQSNGLLIDAGDRTLVGLCKFNNNVGFGIQIDNDADNNRISNCETFLNTAGSVDVANANCNTNVICDNTLEDGAIADVGTNTRAWLNYDPSANAFVATINPPLVVGGGGGALP